LAFLAFWPFSAKYKIRRIKSVNFFGLTRTCLNFGDLRERSRRRVQRAQAKARPAFSGLISNLYAALCRKLFLELVCMHESIAHLWSVWLLFYLSSIRSGRWLSFHRSFGSHSSNSQQRCVYRKVSISKSHLFPI
jgi:hypothetical protein